MTSVFASRKPILAAAGLAVLALPALAPASEVDQVSCSLRTLRGVYQFNASGHNIVNGVAVPKAIIETLIFDGRGGVTTPSISLSANGVIIQPPQGAPGVYTMESDCTGTLTFGDGILFDLQARPNGREVNMLQTNPNTVMQGTGVKVASLASWGG